MSPTASQITSLTIVYSIVYSGADQRTHQSSASLAFVRGIHRRPVNSPHKWPVTRKMLPFDDVIMGKYLLGGAVMTRSNGISYFIQHCTAINQSSYSQKTPPYLTLMVSYGMYIVVIWEKINCVITKPHCICPSRADWSGLVQHALQMQPRCLHTLSARIRDATRRVWGVL